MEMSLLKSPFFLIKQLQRDAFSTMDLSLSGRILDVGCGQSPYRKFLQESTYIGLDRTPFKEVAVLGDAARIPFRDSSVDHVLLTEVLEHTPVPQQTISEVARVLRQGGSAFITAPMTWGLHYDPFDYYRFTKYGLSFLLGQSGLQVERIERIGGLWSVIGARLSDLWFQWLCSALGFLGPRWKERLALMAILPFSLVFYALARVLDRIDPRDALGWAILARKPS